MNRAKTHPAGDWKSCLQEPSPPARKTRFFCIFLKVWHSNYGRPAFSRVGLAQTMRSDRDSFFSLNLLDNKPLLGAVLLTFSLQLAVVYLPFLQGIFKTTALSGFDLAVSLALITIVFWAMELQKWLVRRRRQIS